MTYYVVGFIVFWFLCGFVASGFIFAYFQREFTFIRKDKFEIDQNNAIVCLLFGAIALLISYTGYRSHGWLNPWGKKAKIEAGILNKGE